MINDSNIVKYIRKYIFKAILTFEED